MIDLMPLLLVLPAFPFAASVALLVMGLKKYQDACDKEDYDEASGAVSMGFLFF